LVQDIVELVHRALDVHPGDHALVTPAAVEAVEALGRHAMQLDAGALGDRDEVLQPRVVARLVHEDLQHGGSICAQPRQDRVEAEHDARLALPHAGTRSILRWSTSTRTSLTFMRSASRNRLLVRSPNSWWRVPSYWK